MVTLSTIENNTDNKPAKRINTILDTLLKQFDLNSYYRNHYLTIDEGLRAEIRGEILGREGFSEAERCFRDPQVKACFLRIVFALNRKKPKWVIPEGLEDADAEIAQGVADFHNWTFKKLKGSIKKLIYDLMTAKFFNAAFVEKVFDILPNGKFQGLYYYSKMKAKRPGLWDFHYDVNGNIDGIVSLLRKYNDDGSLLIFPLEKFMYLSWLPLFEDGWGQGDFEAVWKFWDAKVEFLVFILALGSRQSKGKQYTLTSEAGSDPETNQDERDIILKNLMNGLAAYIPQGYKVDVSEFNNDTLSRMIEVIKILDSQIALAMIGNSTSINESIGAGTNAQSQVHKESTEIFQKYAEGILIDKFEEEWAAPLNKLNFPNVPETLYPELKFVDEIELDLLKEAQTDEILIRNKVIDMTTEVDIRYMRNKYNLPENEELLYMQEMSEDDLTEDPAEPEDEPINGTT